MTKLTVDFCDYAKARNKEGSWWKARVSEVRVVVAWCRDEWRTSWRGQRQTWSIIWTLPERNEEKIWLLGHSEYKCGHSTLCLIGRRSDEFIVSCIFPAVKYVVALCRGVFGPAPTFHSLPLDGTPSWTADVAHDALFFFFLPRSAVLSENIGPLHT